MTDIHREALNTLEILARRRDWFTTRTMRGVVFANLGIVPR